MMQTTLPILSIITFLPLLGALIIFLFCKGEAPGNNSKRIALGISLVTFALSLFILGNFDSAATGYQFEEKFEWIANTGIFYHLGIDGISVYFIILTAFLIPVCILASWNSIKKQMKEYMILFLLLEAFCIAGFRIILFLL
jgi:NADH-quinone oxidoreductase subunit M